ncbi:MAG: heparinase II/III family protein [Gemmatimonadales bacterium]
MLLNEVEQERRKREIRGSTDLQHLSRRMRAHLGPVLDGSIPDIPGKARLSRKGGVCPNDGTRLAFDPLNPTHHRCTRCHAVVTGEQHHATWCWWYHLWLSERILHLGLLGALSNEPLLMRRGLELARGYAAIYPTLPNQDNVLGPTRLFFSTYLESIWLAQMAIGLGFIALRAELDDNLRSMVRSSADLIREFDEVWSNRQVWNNTALMAAGTLLGDPELVAHGLAGPHGIRAQLDHGVTTEGMWFEGENYHFFALRGFQLAAELARTQEIDLYAEAQSASRLCGMYTAPIHTLYPDLTMPARGDSPFGVAMAQPRFAELWEVGLVRTNDGLVEGLLASLYGSNYPDGDDVGFEEIAEHEVHRPPAKLTRERLGWRALLWMRPTLPLAANNPPQPVTVFDQAGVALVRPTNDAYASLEVGGARGGHGHPDLLHCNLYLGSPITVDPGTASYVDESLHWYRSREAHNAPFAEGEAALAPTCRAWCEAADAREGWAWCRGTARDTLGPGSKASRTLVVGDSFVLDVVEVEADDTTEVSLPVHLTGAVRTSKDLLRIEAERGEGRALLAPRHDERLTVERGLGPPSPNFAPGDPMTYVMRRAKGSGFWVQAYCAAPHHLDALDVTDTEIRVACDGQEHRITFSNEVARISTPAHWKIKLRGARPVPSIATEPSHRVMPTTLSLPIRDQSLQPENWTAAVAPHYVRKLRAEHYRRSELAYLHGKSIRARAAVVGTLTAIEFAVDVEKRDLVFRRSDARDPELDNERPDIHSDGVQCYIGRDGWVGFLVIPDPDSRTTRTIVLGSHSGGVVAVSGTWTPTEGGYSMVVRCELSRPLERFERFPVNLVINEMYSGRERRAGQLVLSGGDGWVYLRGDRESAENALVAEVV